MDLAKELSIKGHLFNMQIEAIHEKMRENIFRRRLVDSNYMIDLFNWAEQFG